MMLPRPAWAMEAALEAAINHQEDYDPTPIFGEGQITVAIFVGNVDVVHDCHCSFQLTYHSFI